MSLMLKRFSQECDVESESLAVSYFAIFQKENGQELRLPISAEASQAIIAFVADKSGVKEASVEEELLDSTEQEMADEEDRKNATTFGEDDPQDEPEEEYEPESEEQVPSL